MASGRLLAETICTSEEIEKLTAFQEIFFYRLIVNCDDYGRMDARPKMLKSRLFPLKDVRPDQIEDALRALTSAELVIIYNVDGKPFLQMKTWDKHQRIRNKRPKYPGPEDADSQHVVTTRGESPQIAADCRGLPPESNIESNPNTNPNPNPNTKRAGAEGRPYGEYGWVKLTEKQYSKLLNDLGQEELDLCIQYVDESAQKNHNKNKWTDWNLVIRSCHRENWPKRWRKQEDDGSATNNIFLQIYDEEHGR